MKKIKVLIGFSQYSESRFFFKANNIKTSMTGNGNFPEPSPAPDSLNGAFEDYGALLNKGRGCTKVETAIKQQLRNDITSALQQWGAYVEENGNNDRAILLTGGFDLNQERTPVGRLPAPKGFREEKGLVAAL